MESKIPLGKLVNPVLNVNKKIARFPINPIRKKADSNRKENISPKKLKNEPVNNVTNNKEIQRIQIRLNNYNNKYDWWKSCKDAE